jgi:hypothetical protein
LSSHHSGQRAREERKHDRYHVIAVWTTNTHKAFLGRLLGKHVGTKKRLVALHGHVAVRIETLA